MNDYKILSIDIGIHNLGYSLYDVDNNKLFFDLYDIDEKISKNDNIILSRTKIINDFVKNIFTNHNNINTVIIEKQVNVNTMAMELMYLLTATIYNYCDNIIIFDPKQKFTKLSIKYDVKNKNHKKLSIRIIRNYISKYYNDLLDTFDSYTKRDDISDSVFMLFVHLYNDNKKELIKLKQCCND